MSEKLDEDLRSAIKEENIDALSAMIKGDVDINKTIVMKMHTLLTYASFIGRLASVKALIAMGADVDIKDTYERSALLHAARHKKNGLACMEILISAGANVNIDVSDPDKSPIMNCATRGLQNGFQMLLDKEADVNLKTEKGDSILHYILEHSNFNEDLINTVIEKSQDEFLSSKNSKHLTPLMIASQKGKVSCLKSLLIRCKDLVHDFDNEGKTALTHAAIEGKVASLEALIQSGSDVNFIPTEPEQPISSDFEGKSRLKRARTNYLVKKTPLMFASQNGHLNVVVKLIEHGANINQISLNEETALTCAVYKDHVKCVEVLIKAGADINFRFSGSVPVVLLAACNNHMNCVEYLVKKGADVKGLQLLHKVLGHQDHDRLVRLLLRKGVDANAKTWEGVTPLMIAAKNGHLKSLKVLLSKKVEIDLLYDNDFKNRSALMLAASKGNKDCLNCLINKGANVNLANNKGLTALSEACRKGNLDCVTALLAQGAEINPQNKNIEKPLVAAFDSDKTDMVYWLLDHGADINDRDVLGNTFLHFLLNKYIIKNMALVKKCLEVGADVNCTNNNGETLLMAAARLHSEEVLEILLKRGLRVNKVDEKGDTALVHACRRGSSKCLQHLLNAGAYVNLKPKAPTSDTALTATVKVNSIQCVKLLGEHFRKRQNKSLVDIKTCYSHLGDVVNLLRCDCEMLATLAEYGFIPRKELNVLLSFRYLVRERFLTSDLFPIVYQGKEMAPLEAAFRKDDIACVSYLLLNNFIFDTDVSFMFSNSEFRHVSDKNSYRTNTILKDLTKQPWSLQELCFTQIASSVKPFVVGSERNKAVDSLPIPNKFKSQLTINNKMASLCIRSWDDITYHLSREKMTLFDKSTKDMLMNKLTVCMSKCCRNRTKECFCLKLEYYDGYYDSDEYYDSSDSEMEFF